MEIKFSLIYYTIIALFCAMIFIGWLSAVKSEFPILMTLKRWLRFAFFSSAGAVFLAAFMPDHSFINLLAISALAYMFFESLLYWLQVCMINYSGYDIFSSYRQVETAWSSQKKHIVLKNKILAAGFKKSGSFKSTPIEGLEYLMTTFDSDDATMRMSIAFLPYAGVSLMAMSILSNSQDGHCIFTEATTSPFGLEYPKNYDVQRHPLIGNPLSLLKIHKQRIKDKLLLPISTPPAEMLNLQLDDFEDASLQAGLLNPTADLEDLGALSPEGKYRLWLDTIISNYFPFFK